MSLKNRLSKSTLRSLRELRYLVHLALQRIGNRISPSRISMRKKLLRMNNVKLHWGCGQRRLDGWVNIDGWRSDATDYVHDLRATLPFSDGSVDLIFTEHVLEHVEFDIATAVLADFFRALKPGGIVRIVVPDLNKCCHAYLSGDKSWFTKVDAERLTAGDGFNQIFYSHFHRYIYDFETLALILRNAGFSTITQSAPLASADERLRLDNDSESRTLVSLYVEAEK